MSSAVGLFVPTVERIDLGRPKGGRPRKQPLPEEEVHALPPPATPQDAVPLYTVGGHSSTALEPRNRRWYWNWPVNARVQIPSEIEPPKVIQTGSTDSLKHSAKHPLQVLIASSTKYIHDTPDIYEPDVIAEIVSQEIINSYPDLDNETFNARVDGRLLGVIQNPAIRKRPILLLSPSGDVGQLLSIMLFSQTLGKKRDAQPPTSHLAYAFQTPIRQIVCSSLTSPHRLDGCATALVVRLAGATHMLSVVPNPSFVSPTHDLPVTVATIGELPPSSTEGRCHVDVALDPLSWGKAAIVDEGGAVWLWSEQRETINGRVQRTYKVVKLRDSVAQAGDGFFRVAFGVRPGTVLVLSRRTLDMLDLETEGPRPQSTTIMTLSDKSQQFTSIDKSAAQRGAALTCVATTREIIWIDEYQLGAPVFRWIHDYGAGRVKDLEITVQPENPHLGYEGLSAWETIILSSPSSELTEAIRVTTALPVSVVTTPWLIHGLNQGHHLRDLTILPLNGSPVVGFGKDGSLIAARMPTSASAPRSSSFNLAKKLENPNVPAIPRPLPSSEQEEDGVSDDGDWLSYAFAGDSSAEKADTRCKVLQGRWAWSEINDFAQPAAVLDLTDFQKYIREFEAPPEHKLTAGELARSLNMDAAPTTRSSLLPKLGTVSRDTVTKLDDVDFASTFSSVWAVHSGTGVQRTTSGTTLERTPFQKQAYHEESQRLLADLSLSRIILSMDDVVQREVERATPDDLFAEAAGLLSLQERQADPPQFGVLKPKHSLQNTEHEGQAFDFNDINQFLQQWHVGSDPNTFTWSMPQTWSSHSSTAPTSHQNSRPIRPLPSVRVHQSQPVVVAPVPQLRPLVENDYLRTTGVAPVSHHSSPPRPLPASQPSPPRSSFEPYPQTQAERGPFGDRPEAVSKTIRKKATKKRLGGF